MSIARLSFADAGRLTLPGLLERRVQETPDALAVVDSSGSLQYGEWLQAAKGISAALRQHAGVVASDRLLTWLPNGDALSFVSVFHGGLDAGAVVVPVDDQHAHFYSIWYSFDGPMDRAARIAWSGLDPDRDLDDEGYLRRCSLPGWSQNRAAMAAGTSFAGMMGINVQDTIVQESMGPIVDRTKEHLGPGDKAIIHFRRMMLAVARGESRAATADFARHMRYGALRARDGLLPAGADWTTLYSDEERAHWGTATTEVS